MPYKSDDKLNALIKLALEDSTIKEGMEKTSLTSAHLINEIKENADEVWSHEANRIAEYDTREKELARKEKELADKLPPQAQQLYNWEDKPLWALVVGLGILITVGVLYGLLWLFLDPTLAWLLGYMKIGLYVFAGVSILLCLYYVRYQIKARRLARREQERDKWQSEKTEAEKIGGINDDRERLASLAPSIDSELLSKVIKDRLRLFVNRYLDPSYDTTLTVDEAPGLAEIIDPARTVDTSAKTSLRFMLENMPGGSIGVAGPRGSGKSTLIQAYCGPNRVVTEIKSGRPILPVLVSAPVEYEARDFILYIFSATCESVLKVLEVPNVRPELHMATAKSPRTVFAPLLAAFLGFAPGLFVYIGMLLIIFSLTVAMLLTTLTRGRKFDPAQYQQFGKRRRESPGSGFTRPGAGRLQVGRSLSKSAGNDC